MFVVSALKSSLLRLLTTHNAAESRQIGSTEMKKKRKMSSLVQVKEDGIMGRGVTRPKWKVRVVELAAAM